jgi:PDZ domain/Aspartyl protease
MIVAAASFTFACSAAAVLGQVAAATGGASWKRVSEVVASGRLTSSGLHGIAQTYDDLRDGRFALHFRLPVKGTSAEVYDGHTVWARDISGGVHPYDSWYPRARAVTESYLTRRAYLDPHERAGATCVGVAKGGIPIALVRLAPSGGIPATLSIDTRTRLIDSVAIRTPITIDLTTFADYRQVGALVLPFAISFSSTYEPANADRIEVTRYAIMPRVNAADFARPAARESARMLGGTGSTTVPIVLEGRQLLVWASIDGRPAMPFILDTGGHAILDTVAAKTLGLRAAGAGVSGGAGAGTIALQYARIKSVRIGDAELLDQPFLVIPYPYDFYERGRKAPLAGILGLEWFERYAARIDYARRTLTLTPLRAFSYDGHGTPVPMRFQEDMPLARASAEGRDGSFGVDTGNAGVVVLYGDFLGRSGLLAKHAGGYAQLGKGTGGGNSGRIETLSTFAIGGHTLPNLAAYFTQMKSGSFSSWTEAGDLGLTVLSRFTPTFDYADQTLYLDPAARPLVLPPNRSGLTFEKNRPGAIDVLAVRPNSAASELGIVAGDQIVAVNGKDARDLSSADFLDAVTAPQGTPVQLTIAHGATTRTVQLILR